MNEKALAAAERVDAGKAIDQTALISDLSHQLEEARAQIEELEAARRNLQIKLIRVEGARDSLRELLVETLKRE
jgi:hypothetical protein